MSEEIKIAPRKKEDRTEAFWEILNNVLDPDVGYGIVDLGLVYDVLVNEDDIATVYMTFTTPACPSAGQIVEDVENTLENYPDFKEVYVEIVWEPMWNKDMIDEDIRIMLFGE